MPYQYSYTGKYMKQMDQNRKLFWCLGFIHFFLHFRTHHVWRGCCRSCHRQRFRDVQSRVCWRWPLCGREAQTSGKAHGDVIIWDVSHINGSLWGESTSQPGVSHHKMTSNEEFLFAVSLDKFLNMQSSCRWLETAWRLCDITVISECYCFCILHIHPSWNDYGKPWQFRIDCI